MCQLKFLLESLTSKVQKLQDAMTKGTIGPRFEAGPSGTPRAWIPRDDLWVGSLFLAFRDDRPTALVHCKRSRLD